MIKRRTLRIVLFETTKQLAHTGCVKKDGFEATHRMTLKMWYILNGEIPNSVIKQTRTEYHGGVRSNVAIHSAGPGIISRLVN
jgi:hypothetical protein